MTFEKTAVFNIEGALRGMRNPMESWGKSDSGRGCCKETNGVRFVLCKDCGNPYCNVDSYFQIGKNDLQLAQTLIKAGSEQRKFMRQIFVSVDITAPLYWWKEFDTYKVGTVANSTSTMHKLAETPITRDCFEMDDFKDVWWEDGLQEDGSGHFISRMASVENIWARLINDLEKLRKRYLETKDKRYWKELIRLLPESWLQKRTVTMDYENLFSIVHQRRCHKLAEWSEAFVAWAKALPYAEELIFTETADVNGRAD